MPAPQEIAEILAHPSVQAAVADRIGPVSQVTHLGGSAYQVTGSNGDFVLRFPRDEAHLSALRREQRVAHGMQGVVDVQVPDTTLIEADDGGLAFAIHCLIQGVPLETEILERQTEAGYRRFVEDLVRFYVRTHSVPLGQACEWLDIPPGHERTLDSLAARWGKPIWFDTQAVRNLRPQVIRLLDDRETTIFYDTVRQFEALEPDPTDMVFGHGDMHGYNMAVGEDEQGLRLLGVFDLECAGILDRHEDFFRISLVSEALLDQVLVRYQQACPEARIDRERIAVYYRSFLFYLMEGKSGERLAHLKRLLQRHVAYSSSRIKGAGGI